MTKPLIYLAGPYTNPDPVINTHKAIKVATALIDSGYPYCPVIPHLTLLHHMVTPKPLEFWYEHDLNMLAACAAVVRLPGASSGADMEMEFAAERGIEQIPFIHLPDSAIDAWTA